MNEFDSDFANVKYMKAENIVLLTWKKEAHLEDYRSPTLYALELLRTHLHSNFVVDARNGFEDDKRDVTWGFNFLLPEMAKTSCKFVSFIMHEQNDIAEEMDMWTLEFGKYFAVTRATDYISAVSSIHQYILADVTYTIKTGKREEFIQQLIQNNIIDASRKEPGNIKYDILLPIDSNDKICLIEMWTNQIEQKRHTQTLHYQILTTLKAQYVEDVQISCYEVKKL